MKNNTKNFFIDPIEESALLRQEEIRKSMAPGLFSLSPTWFRANKYEIIETNHVLYIKPQKNCEIEWYRPFEEFPIILENFLECLMKLQAIKGDNYNDKGPTNKHWERAEVLLNFVQKYGLMGLFWNGIQDISDTEAPGKNYKIFPKWPLPSTIRYLYTIGKWDGSPMDYDMYVERFFPQLEAPYPIILEKKDREKFFQNYSEPVQNIVADEIFNLLNRHLRDWNDFKTNRYDLEESYKGSVKYLSRRGVTWKDILQMSLYPAEFSMALIYEDKWEIAYRYKSLIGALGIMYFLNFTGKMGDVLSVCQLEGCNKITRGQKYCSLLHGERDRKRRERKRRKAKELLKEGMTIEEVSLKLNIGINEIKEALKNGR